MAGSQIVGTVVSDTSVDDTSKLVKDAHAAVAITATADGLTTGIVPEDALFCTVTSAAAANIVTLPTGTIGDPLVLQVTANGCELRTPSGSSADINDIDCDVTNELAIPADTTVVLNYVADDKWIARAWSKVGAALATLLPDAQ